MPSVESSSHASNAVLELWHVQMRSGEVRPLTLDGLDDAFQSGTVDEYTPVLPPGAIAWKKLGDVAGLDPEPPAQSLAPMALDLASSPSSPAAVPSADTVDLPDDAFAPKGTRARSAALVLVALTVASALGFVAMRASRSEAASAVAANAISAPAKVAAAPPPAMNVPDTKSAPAPALTEEQKQRLLEADKAREARATRAAEERVKKQAPRGRGASSTKNGAGMVTGGSKYDPLNGAL